MSIEIGRGLPVEKRNELVRRIYEFLKEHTRDLFGEDVSITPKYLEKKLMLIFHWIDSFRIGRWGPLEKVKYSTKEFKDHHLSGSIEKRVKEEYDRYIDIKYEGGIYRKSERVALNYVEIRVGSELYVPYINAEEVRDKLTGRFRGFHVHYVLVPSRYKIPVEKIPFISLKELNEKYILLYHLPPLEISLEDIDK